MFQQAETQRLGAYQSATARYLRSVLDENLRAAGDGGWIMAGAYYPALCFSLIHFIPDRSLKFIGHVEPSVIRETGMSDTKDAIGTLGRGR